jgi:hypothetical protein
MSYVYLNKICDLYIMSNRKEFIQYFDSYLDVPKMYIFIENMVLNKNKHTQLNTVIITLDVCSIGVYKFQIGQLHCWKHMFQGLFSELPT